jgi:hypothetical protein
MTEKCLQSYSYFIGKTYFCLTHFFGQSDKLL